MKSVKNLLTCLIKKLKHKNVILYGELYGIAKGGQKSIHYGIPNKLGYAAFAIKADGKYINYEDVKSISK